MLERFQYLFGCVIVACRYGDLGEEIRDRSIDLA
jgi:hypothetical protein